VFERSALNLIFDLAIPQSAFKSDELPLLESFGELREIPPGIDTMPVGPGLVVAFVVLPTLLGCDIEHDVLAVVLIGFPPGFLRRREATSESGNLSLPFAPHDRDFAGLCRLRTAEGPHSAP
jgi:hypothetical protein